MAITVASTTPGYTAASVIPCTNLTGQATLIKGADADTQVVLGHSLGAIPEFATISGIANVAATVQPGAGVTALSSTTVTVQMATSVLASAQYALTIGTRHSVIK